MRHRDEISQTFPAIITFNTMTNSTQRNPEGAHFEVPLSRLAPGCFLVTPVGQSSQPTKRWWGRCKMGAIYHLTMLNFVLGTSPRQALPSGHTAYTLRGETRTQRLLEPHGC